MVDLSKRLLGPHEWGYRDPVEGGFIEDNAPFEAAAALDAKDAENARLMQELHDAEARLAAVQSIAERVFENAGNWLREEAFCAALNDLRAILASLTGD